MAYIPENRASLRLLSLVGLAFVATGFAFAAGPQPASGIIINHAFKVKTLGITCDVCHSPSEANPRLMAFPNMDTCGACHAEDVDMSAGTDACVKCHSTEDYSSKMRKDRVLMPGVVFDHGKHAAAKVDCQSCHKVYDKVGVKGDEMLPKMATCVTCHTAKQVGKAGDCAVCHTDSSIGSEKPANHTALWPRSHGKNLSSKTIEQSCAVCHTTASGNDCVSCHQHEAPKNHTSAWDMQGHAQVATAKRQSCATCHTENQCIDCHTRQRPFTHTGAWGGSSARHCYSCHLDSAGSYGTSAARGNCVVCHSAAGTQAKHQSVPRLASKQHFSGNDCSFCHTPTQVAPPHPNPITSTGLYLNAACASCHLDR
ncbi:MAG: cytochrome c3 family protein [Spirochaetota bacterium]